MLYRMVCVIAQKQQNLRLFFHLNLAKMLDYDLWARKRINTTQYERYCDQKQYHRLCDRLYLRKSNQVQTVDPLKVKIKHIDIRWGPVKIHQDSVVWSYRFIPANIWARLFTSDAETYHKRIGIREVTKNLELQGKWCDIGLLQIIGGIDEDDWKHSIARFSSKVENRLSCSSWIMGSCYGLTLKKNVTKIDFKRIKKAFNFVPPKLLKGEQIGDFTED